jgi:hypothetical protein
MSGMSVFEAIMLLCFGAAWPASIYRTAVTRSVKGKSLLFLVIVFVGYLAGVAHKALYSPDPVLLLYVLNALMVLADILLYLRYRTA